MSDASKIILTEGTAPGTPAADTLVIYSKTDDKVYKKNSAGVEAEIGGGMSNVVEDTTPQLGGALDTNAFAIDDSYATVTSAATTSAIWAAAGNIINFTGNATITDFPAASRAGAQRFLICAGTPAFTHAGNITVQGGATYTAAAGDVAIVTATTTTAFKVNILKQDGKPIFNLLASSISDSDTTHAPDGNSVFDALALKAPLISPSFTTPALGTPSSGTLTSCTGYPISLATAPAADTYSVGSVVVTATAVSTTAIGSLCYLDANKQMALADADASATMPGLYMATAVITAGQPGVFLRSGIIHLHTLNPGWTAGEPAGLIYAGSGATTSHTAGAIAQAVPTGSGDQVQIVGVALDTDVLDFSPDKTVIELT
jgi:hypothetical protein